MLSCGLTMRLLPTQEDTVTVTVSRLKVFGRHAAGELVMLTVGEFFMSGGLWLAVDRYFANGWNAPGMGMFVAMAAMGLTLMVVGLWFMIGRALDINQIVKSAQNNPEKRP